MVTPQSCCAVPGRSKASAEMPGIDTLPAVDTPAYVHCRPGQTISHPRPGDIILVRHKHWLSLLIRCFVRIRHRAPEDRPHTYWSHVALVLSRPARWWKSTGAAWSSATSGNTANATITMFGLI